MLIIGDEMCLKTTTNLFLLKSFTKQNKRCKSQKQTLIFYSDSC